MNIKDVIIMINIYIDLQILFEAANLDLIKNQKIYFKINYKQ